MRDSDETQHNVTLTHKFEIMSTEVTQGQFTLLRGYSPSSFTSCGNICPVDTVNWHEAAAYCNALSGKASLPVCYTCSGSGTNVTCQETASPQGKGIYTCKGFRLPTEAEWEYAYRGGTSSAFYNGGITNCTSTDPNADKIGWYGQNSNNKTHPLGLKAPNTWGLYDMAGNVWEWCHDLHQSDLGTAAKTNPVGSASASSSRVLRGGAHGGKPGNMRAANRNQNTSTVQYGHIGFRCVRTTK